MVESEEKIASIQNLARFYQFYWTIFFWPEKYKEKFAEFSISIDLPTFF